MEDKTLDYSISKLTEILLKEEFNKEKKEKYFTLSKKDLIRFCIKLLKTIEKSE